jgi:hypothetical protein
MACLLKVYINIQGLTEVVSVTLCSATEHGARHRELRPHPFAKRTSTASAAWFREAARRNAVV